MRSLSASAVAGIIRRGVSANFAPENREAELRKLSELFSDFAMSRQGEAELARGNDRLNALKDALWLDSVARMLDY
jgi:hypothetical protein